MTMHHTGHSVIPPAPRGDRPNSAWSGWLVRILMFGLLAVGAYYVIAEHGAHLLSAWPLLILLACPLMHLFHGGHGGHGGRDEQDNTGGRNG